MPRVRSIVDGVVAAEQDGTGWVARAAKSVALRVSSVQVHGGQIVLMDAGCEYFGYASDVTRTWPVGGRYTPEQRRAYETVLSVRQQ